MCPARESHGRRDQLLTLRRKHRARHLCGITLVNVDLKLDFVKIRLIGPNSEEIGGGRHWAHVIPTTSFGLTDASVFSMALSPAQARLVISPGHLRSFRVSVVQPPLQLGVVLEPFVVSVIEGEVRCEGFLETFLS